MIIRSLIAALAAALILTPTTAAAQTAAPSPAAAAPAPAASPLVADPKIEALAKNLLHGAQTGTLDRSMMTDQMTATMTPEMTQRVATTLTALGDYSSFTYAGTQMQNGLTVYQFIVVYKTLTLSEYIALTPDGKIAGLSFGK